MNCIREHRLNDNDIDLPRLGRLSLAFKSSQYLEESGGFFWSSRKVALWTYVDLACWV
jgi:hypothetical protein